MITSISLTPTIKHTTTIKVTNFLIENRTNRLIDEIRGGVENIINPTFVSRLQKMRINSVERYTQLLYTAFSSLNSPSSH